MTIPERLRILTWCWGRQYRHWFRSRRVVRRWLGKRARLRFPHRVNRIPATANGPTLVTYLKTRNERPTDVSIIPGDFGNHTNVTQVRVRLRQQEAHSASVRHVQVTPGKDGVYTVTESVVA